ncbi:hypothetical protein [Nocardioides dilutus]
MSKLLTALALLVALALAPPAYADEEPPPSDGSGEETAQIEDYASYEPQTTCHPKPRAGTKVLAAWLKSELGGGGGATGRACGGGASEHKDGRAIDWTLDATKKTDRKIAKAFLELVFAADEEGNTHALARRMGIMYIIWNDHMYAAWDQFEREDYLSSSCKSKRKCSKTLRHRDHVHISLSMAGAKGKTSWYDGRM